MKILSYLVVLIFLFFIIPPETFSYFVEDFNGGFSNPSTWEVNYNNQNVSFTQDEIILSSPLPSNSFPYIKNVTDIFPSSGAFYIEIKAKYHALGGWGDGITIYSSLPQNNNTSVVSQGVLFNLWRDSSLGLNLYSWICEENVNVCPIFKVIYDFSQQNTNNYQTFRIEFDNQDKYSVYVYVNNQFENIFTSNINQPRPLGISIGNPSKTGSNLMWNDFSVDYIKIGDLNEEQEVTKNPIIIIPGMGASWDMNALINGIDGGNWVIPDYIDLYNPLLTSIEKNGYVIDENLFVFPYDWRRNLDTLADRLKSFIDSKNFPDQTKINLVGHSMGGLVARTYAQKYGAENIDKLITIASPHLGTANAYSIWEGAKVWDDIWWERVALELGIQLNDLPGQTRIEVARTQFPGAKDILPTYDFLRKDGSLISFTSMKQKNNFLHNLNQDQDQITPILKPLIGTGLPTLKEINVKEPSALDKLFGLWEDGKPVSNSPFVNSDGDSTVISESAGDLFQTVDTLNKSHVNIVCDEDSVAKILTMLGLDSSNATGSNIENNGKAFVAALRSPGKLQVCDESIICDDSLGIVDQQNKVFILPNYNKQNLIVKVLSDGYDSGDYSLHIGDIDDDSQWMNISGNISQNNQIDTYQFSSNNELNVEIEKDTLMRNINNLSSRIKLISKNWDKDNKVNKFLNAKNIKLKIELAENIQEKLRVLVEKNKTNHMLRKDVLEIWDSINMEIKRVAIFSDCNYKNKNEQDKLEELSKKIDYQINNVKTIPTAEFLEKAKTNVQDSQNVQCNNLLREYYVEGGKELFETALKLR